MVFNRVSTISTYGPPIQPLFGAKDKIFFQDFKHLRHFKDDETQKSELSAESNNNSKSNQLLPRHFLISKAFHPLLRTMRFLGSLPIRIKAVPGTETISYEYHPFSVIFLYSWLTILVLFALFVTFILNRELEIDWPFQLFLHNDDPSNFYKNPTGDGNTSSPGWILGVNQIFRIIIPAFALTNILLVRVRALPIVTFVNGWAPILHEFETIFEPHYKIRLGYKLERAHWFIVPLLGAVYIIPLIQINISKGRFFLSDHLVLTIWSKSIFVIFIVSAMILSSIVTVLSLLTIRSVYAQIRKAISQQYQDTGGKLSYQQVKAWVKLITMVREQVHFFIRFASMPELNDLLFTFVSVLTMSYTAISLYLENVQNSIGILPNALIALAIAFLRTYVKGQLADSIVNEEHSIGLDVIEMRVVPNKKVEDGKEIYWDNDDDEAYAARFEMSILCNMIFTSPVQIRLGNIISLNKKLLLLIISQLASYLVVFLQFKRSPP